MNIVRKVERGAIVNVWVLPRAKKEGVIGLHGNRLKVGVAAPPEKGRANDAILETLARFLGRRPRELELVSGLTSRGKEVLVLGASELEIETRIESALANETKDSRQRKAQ